MGLMNWLGYGNKEEEEEIVEEEPVTAEEVVAEVKEDDEIKQKRYTERTGIQIQ